MALEGSAVKKWWPVSDSNQGHRDFQSPALPTELTGRLTKSGEMK